VKAKGYILFIHYSKCKGWSDGIEIHPDYCTSFKELKDVWHREWDDKWDVINRDRINYFYLDLSTGKYTPLPKWKNPYDPGDFWDADTGTVMSKRYFK
jgi:hypothetical protein